MRAIEFRFWSGDKMFYMEDFDTFNSVLDCLKQQLMFEHEIEERDHRLLEGPYDHVGEHGASFMQYTGLKDAKGNKIFEGDILNVDNSNALVEVAWIDDGWCVYDENLNVESWLEKDYEPLSPYSRSSVVIGNIYENKELLNEQI